MDEAKRDELNRRLQDVEAKLEPLLAEQEDIQSELIEMELEDYQQSIGLHTFDEVLLTPEFEAFERRRDNDPDYYCKNGKPLRIDILYQGYIARNVVSVSDGSCGVGGVPVEMAQRMREAWLEAQK